MFGNIEDLSGWHGDGVIARVADPEHASVVERMRIPVVDVAGAYTERGFAHVTNDDRRTGFIAGAHFLGHGLRQLAYCDVADVRWSKERARNLAATANEAGVAMYDSRSFERPLHWWETPRVDRELVTFLRSLSRPVGLFAANDTVALNVVRAARLSGIEMTSDIAVLGVDNEDITCELTEPELDRAAARRDRPQRGRTPRPHTLRSQHKTRRANTASELRVES